MSWRTLASFPKVTAAIVWISCCTSRQNILKSKAIWLWNFLVVIVVVRSTHNNFALVILAYTFVRLQPKLQHTLGHITSHTIPNQFYQIVHCNTDFHDTEQDVIYLILYFFKQTYLHNINYSYIINIIIL